ncbi:helix-turn-helix domain-containing protein (plasmid) [Streptomyces sp. NBC_00825]|uniref:helix-turn-helix domain-containing protein n=1 Tax=unclassified Streptomyces TaxID=2593676 RepID=UPI002ED52F3A|nr:helix-turn-helix domain-containing protein [Streptomyces sp. NBC_00826]WTH96281.1 helix-turn-helix domain-containing protein [Streptomyces sp. NBC_00825]WTI04696.1 helix-turn-helix domain-containing protein [Streptomyces sp. NBC_00822]
MDAVRARAVPAADVNPGELVRLARKERGLTLAQLGELAGYSAAQVSRYERGISPLTDVTDRRFADALGIPPQVLGLAPQRDVRHGQVIGPTTAYPRLPAPRACIRSAAMMLISVLAS